MRLQTEQKHFYSHKKNEMRSSLNANFKEANNDENMASGENEDLEQRTKQVEEARMGGSEMPTQKAQIRTALRNQRDMRSFLMERIEYFVSRYFEVPYFSCELAWQVGLLFQLTGCP